MEPLDKIPALQAEFELAEKKNMANQRAGNLNERPLAENMKNLCRFWLDKKVYFFSWQWHCNISVAGQ